MVKRRRVRRRRIAREQLSVTGEAEYIVRCATRRDARVITLGPLLFPPTRTGDAWVLDPADSLARPLARDGDELPAGIYETAGQFGVEWSAAFRVEGSLFVVVERATGSVRAVAGYPAREIANAIRGMV